MTGATIDGDSDVDAVETAIRRATDALFRAQRKDGSWVDHLSSSAVATAPALLSLHLADPVRHAKAIAEGCAWLRATQHADGSWGDAVVDSGTLNATAITVPILAILERERSVDAISRGLAFIELQGGEEALRDLERCSIFPLCLQFMAMAGLYDADRVHRMPSELILVPQRFRRWFAVSAPCVYSWGMMQSRQSRSSRRVQWLQRIAEPKAIRFLEQTQGSNGGYEESAILTACVYIGLRKADVGHAVADRCLEYLVETRRADGSWPIDRDLELSVTTYILRGLHAAGKIRDPRLARTADWIASGQHDRPWEATGAPAGGWAWARPSGWPDADDTACATLALERLGRPEHRGAVVRGCDWLLAMQNSDGSWGGFLRNGRLSMDQPCAALTSHAVLALREAGGFGPRDKCIRNALRYFSRVQRPDGAVPTLWFRHFTCGTAWVLNAYAALGLPYDPVAVRCRAWLLRHQNSDGGWGSLRGTASTVEETAWALTALAAGGVPSSHTRLEAAARWLVEHQNAEGTWEPSVICHYYSHLSYSSDHIANGFALEALGRFHRGRGET
ncbi:hypothetical protein LVJ94_29320 [Pendulispora rubella]|uniref:Squalene--hopene cyclase n=2 Tax=Pendulispora rubella TaxID=2741070 RepID=A0ABZ2KQT2_9BACT